MFPAAEAVSHSSTSFSRSISQNPRPNFPADTHQPRSSSFKIDINQSNGGFNFDFSKVGSNPNPNPSGQARPRGVRLPVKKLRRKLGSENKKFMEGMILGSSNGTDEASISTTAAASGTTVNGAANNVNYVFDKMGYVFVANENSFGQKLSNERHGFVFGTNGSGLSLKSSNENRSFVFGVSNSGSELNFSIGNGVRVFGGEKGNFQSNLNPKNENVVFGTGKSSSSLNMSNGNVGFVFSANEKSSAKTLSMGNLSAVLGSNASNSMLKSSLQNESLFSACKSTSCSSSNLGQMGQPGADELQNFYNVGFVFGAKEDELSSDSKLKQKGSKNRSMRSVLDKSETFNNVGCVFGANKTSTAPEDKNPEKKDHGENIWNTVTDMRGKMKLDAGGISEKDGQTSFAFGTDWNNDGKKDNYDFAFGAKETDLKSTAELGKSKISKCAGTSGFVAKANENADIEHESQNSSSNGVFVFGCSGMEKLSSSRNNEYGGKQKLHEVQFCEVADEKTGNSCGFVKFPDDAMRSNFEFVIGRSSTPGSALYKVPLSKLFDDMKSLKIDDSKGSNGDKVKQMRSNSCFCADNLSATQNGGHPADFSTERIRTSSRNQHHQNADMSNTNTSDSETSASGNNLRTGNSFRGSVKVMNPGATNIIDSRFRVGVSSEVNLSCSSTEVFGKENQPSNSSGNTLPGYQMNHNSYSSKTSSYATCHVQQTYSSFQAPPTTKEENKDNLNFTSTPIGPGASSVKFDAPNLNMPSPYDTTAFSGLSKNLEFFANSATIKEKRLKKTRKKLRQRILTKEMAGQDNISKEGSKSKMFESPGSCSPMDFSPYQNTTDGAPASLATERKGGDSSAGIQRFGFSEGDGKSVEQDNLNSMGCCESNAKSTTSSSAQDGLSSTRRQYRKKYKLKIGDGFNGKPRAPKVELSFSSVQFSPYDCNSSHKARPQVQNGVTSNTHSKTDGEHTQDPSEAATHGACEHWRIRGNQAYKTRDLHTAEEFYTRGINSVPDNCVAGTCIEPLLLCYSNRAATRMSLGRMREALEDCKSAAALNPSFLKVKIRAANCHLVLGEFQEAMQYYNSCLESGNRVCLDRRFTIEAADGLQKAQKVAEYMCQSSDFLKQRTSDTANSALGILVDALSISCYSEELLEMKGEALLLLRRYEEVIKLCEQTLHIAEKNFTTNHLENEDSLECRNYLMLWRWRLMSKSHFHLGMLEVALDLIEKQEQLTSISNRYRSMNQESPIPLAATIRDLLQRKKAGNEAFQSGKHLDAVEYYTAAISSGIESRPFAAICFCNRAAAHQALGQIIDAIADCSLAIALDRNYIKAVSRRATLHEMIRDYKQATDDLQRLIVILENRSQEKTRQSGRHDGSSGDIKELKQAHCRLSLIEDKARKGTSLDLYLILGIKASDTESEIKKAYRKAALKHHPDKAGQFLARNDTGDDGRLWKDIVEKVHEDADKLFKMIGEAYAVLSDPDKRSKYDDEQEIRDFCTDSNRNTNSGRRSDFYSSPYDRGHSSGRQSHYYSSPFDRSRNRRHWQESWRSYDDAF